MLLTDQNMRMQDIDNMRNRSMCFSLILNAQGVQENEAKK